MFPGRCPEASTSHVPHPPSGVGRPRGVPPAGSRRGTVDRRPTDPPVGHPTVRGAVGRRIRRRTVADVAVQLVGIHPVGADPRNGRPGGHVQRRPRTGQRPGPVGPRVDHGRTGRPRLPRGQRRCHRAGRRRRRGRPVGPLDPRRPRTGCRSACIRRYRSGGPTAGHPAAERRRRRSVRVPGPHLRRGLPAGALAGSAGGRRGHRDRPRPERRDLADLPTVPGRRVGELPADADLHRGPRQLPGPGHQFDGTGRPRPRRAGRARDPP